MSNILRFTVEENLPPPKHLFSSQEVNFYRTSFSGPIQGYCKHGFLQNFLIAYNNDLPLYLSPDDIWLLITQGFSYHVDNNAERLRKYFVDFEGKKELVVERLDLTPEIATVDDWRGIISEFRNDLKKNVKGNLVETVDFDFSTTALDTKIAGNVILMSAMKHYFEYRVIMDGCGIPYIELDGTVEDWENVLHKANSLKQYELSWWIDELLPILNKIIDTKKGNIDIDFWKNMIKEKQSNDFYDPGYISGWITKFFPYNKEGERCLSDRIYEIEEVAPQILEAPFKLDCLNAGKEYDCNFHAGFIGVTQDPTTLVVKPLIGWYISMGEERSLSKDEVKSLWDKCKTPH